MTPAKHLVEPVQKAIVKTQFRDGTYNVSTDNYPVSWKRHDNFTTQHADYADYHDYIMEDNNCDVLRGMRRDRNPDPYF